MSLLPPLVAELQASTTEFKEKMAEARGEMDETAAEGEKSGSGLASFGKSAALGIGAIGVAAAAISVDLAEKYQSATASMAGQAGITIAAAKKIGDAFDSTGFHSTFSAQEMMTAYAPVAGQLGEVEGHALSAGEALDVMKTAADLAEASGTSLNSATSDLATTMQAFQLTTGQAADAANTLFNAGRLTGQGVDAVSSTIDKLRSKLGGVSPNMTDLSGTLVALTNAGVTGRAAVSDLSTGIGNLVAPTTTGAKELKKLGITVTDQYGQFVGMKSIVTQLGNAFQPMTEAQEAAAGSAIFGTTAYTGMLAMINAGPQAFSQAAAAVTKHGAAEKAAAEQAHTFHGELKTAEAGAEDLGIKLGTALLPVIAKLIGVISDTVGWFIKHKTVTEVLAGVIGGVLVAALTAAVVETLAEVAALAVYVPGMIAAAAATAAAEAPMILIVAAIALLVVGIYELVTHWKLVSEVAKQVWSDVKQWTQDGVNAVKGVFNDIMSFFKKWGVDILAVFVPFIGIPILIATHWQEFVADVKSIFGDVLAFLASLPDKLAELAGEAIGAYIKLWLDLPGELMDILTTAVEDFPKFSEAVMSELGHLASDMIGWIAKGVAWAAKINTDVIEALIGFFEALPGKAISFVTQLGSDLIGLVGTLQSDALKLGTAILTGLWSFVTDLPSKLGDLISALTHLLTSAASDAAKAAEGLAKSMWDGFKKGLFGSPKTKMEYALINARAGMMSTLKGIQTDFGSLTVKGIGGSVSPSFATGSSAISPALMAPAAVQAGGGGSTVINVTVQGQVLSPSGLAASLVEPMRQVLTAGPGRSVSNSQILSSGRTQG